MELYLIPFAVIGVIVFVVGLLGLLTVAAGFVLFRTEHYLNRLAHWIYHAGGGVPDGVSPKPPWDRLYIEVKWLGNVVRHWQSPFMRGEWTDNNNERPDLDELYSLREEHYGSRDWRDARTDPP